MKPKWQKLASLAQKNMYTFQFFGAVFASKGYHFKNILVPLSCEDDQLVVRERERETDRKT